MADKENEKLKVIYFPMTARGQMVTSVLDVVGKDYELKVIKFEDWEEEKPDAPFGALPYIEVEGKKIGGTLTIARFIAERYGKGKIDQESDPFIAAYQEGQADIAHAVLVRLYTYYWAKEELKVEKEKEFVKYAEDKLVFLENSIKPGGEFQGKDGMITWAEVIISSLLRDVKIHYNKHEELLEKFPNLNALCVSVCKILSKK